MKFDATSCAKGVGTYWHAQAASARPSACFRGSAASMLRYIVRRLLGSIPTLLIIIAMTFLHDAARPRRAVRSGAPAAAEIEKTSRRLRPRQAIASPIPRHRLADLQYPFRRLGDAEWLQKRGLTQTPEGKFFEAGGREARCLGGYLGKLLQGDLDLRSNTKTLPSPSLIADGAPVSLRLGSTAILLATIIGMLLGTFAALRQNNGRTTRR